MIAVLAGGCPEWRGIRPFAALLNAIWAVAFAERFILRPESGLANACNWLGQVRLPRRWSPCLGQDHERAERRRLILERFPDAARRSCERRRQQCVDARRPGTSHAQFRAFLTAGDTTNQLVIVRAISCMRAFAGQVLAIPFRSGGWALFRSMLGHAAAGPQATLHKFRHPPGPGC